MPQIFTAAWVKHSSPILCSHRWEAHAPSLTPLLLLTENKHMLSRDAPSFSCQAGGKHTISKRGVKVAAGGCEGGVMEGRSVQPVAGSCQTHTWARGSSVGNGNPVSMISMLMLSAGAIYSQ